jgi:hypothetical protein
VPRTDLKDAGRTTILIPVARLNVSAVLLRINPLSADDASIAPVMKLNELDA